MASWDAIASSFLDGPGRLLPRSLIMSWQWPTASALGGVGETGAETGTKDPLKSILKRPPQGSSQPPGPIIMGYIGASKLLIYSTH